MVEPVLSKDDPATDNAAIKSKLQDGESGDAPLATLPIFIKLKSPPPFDIQKHMTFIRSQLPKDQLNVLEAAIDSDPQLFEKFDSSDNYLDCSAEESFTLESFSSLLMAAKSAGKDFILSRVTTLDPMAQPLPQLFYSYYSAHHLNKILFRTQPEEGLLHRMKSRNPLNNMLIVGDVDYFVVSLSSKVPSTPACSTDVFSNLQQKPREKRITVTEPVNVVPFANAAEFTSPRPQPITLNLNRSNSSLSQLAASPSLHALLADAREPAILYTAHPFATDEDFLMRADMREYFRINSVNPDDYLLFTLYRSNDPAPPPSDISNRGFVSVPIPPAPATTRVSSWKNCWGFFYPPSPSLARVKTGIISRAAFKYVFALYLIGCVAALVFLVPIYLIYYAALGMFVFILLVSLFLVECNPDPTNQSQRFYASSASSAAPRKCPHYCQYHVHTFTRRYQQQQ